MLDPQDHDTHRTPDGRPVFVSVCPDCCELLRAAGSLLVLREYLRRGLTLPG